MLSRNHSGPRAILKAEYSEVRLSGLSMVKTHT